MGKVSTELLLCFVMGMMYRCLSETTLELSVTGAIQNGVGRYVVPTGQTVEISCKTRRFPAMEFWIRKEGGETLLQRTFPGPSSIVTETVDIVGEVSSSGYFVCGFYRRVKRKDSAFLTFQSESMIELVVLTLEDLPRCFSSLGQSGLQDEETDLVCSVNDQVVSDEDILWRGLDTDVDNYGSFNFYAAEIPVKNQPSQLSCGYLEIKEGSQTSWNGLCYLPPLAIFEHTELHMTPTEFNDKNKTLSFMCESNPPASLIRWSIFGHDENIIDDWLTAKLKGDIVVNITQGFGRSILQMSGSAVDSDGVHIIACSTTRGNYKIAVSQYSDNIDDGNPTSELETTVEPSTSKTIPYPSSVCFDALSSGSSNAGLVVVIVLLTIVVIILVVMSVWFYKHYRRNHKNNNSTRRTISSISDRNITMQGNATYQPLSVVPPIAPPAYADLDVGYATMSTPELDDQHYMEPSSVVPKGISS